MSLEIENKLIQKKINEIKENELYLCPECSSNIEIISLDETKNILSFKCPSHGSKTMAIKDYLNDMNKKKLLYSKCNSCKKR